jgi:3D (Asp-Asp-Asp) domain-containing protein
MTMSLTAPREYHTQQIHYLRKGIAFANALATVDVGVIPAGSVILHPISGVYVTQVFNAGTNNRLDIGASTDSGTNNFGTLLSLLALGVVPLDEGTALTPMVTVDTLIQAYVDVTGTAATTGTAEIIIAYVPDNDL